MIWNLKLIKMFKKSQKLYFCTNFAWFLRKKTEEELDHGVWSRNFNEYCSYFSIELRFLGEFSLNLTKNQLITQMKIWKWKILEGFDFFFLENNDKLHYFLEKAEVSLLIQLIWALYVQSFLYTAFLLKLE